MEQCELRSLRPRKSDSQWDKNCTKHLASVEGNCMLNVLPKRFPVKNPLCGNGILQRNEQCDEVGEYCCTVNCQFNIRDDFKDPCIFYDIT